MTGIAATGAILWLFIDPTGERAARKAATAAETDLLP